MTAPPHLEKNFEKVGKVFENRNGDVVYLQSN